MKVFYWNVFGNVSEIFIKQRTQQCTYYMLLCMLKKENMYVYTHISLEGYVRHWCVIFHGVARIGHA